MTTTTTNKDNSESLLTSMEMQAAKEASVQIVCEYLSLEWQTKLLSHLQMTTLVDNKDDSNNNTTTSTLKRSRECWETTTTPGQDDADNLLQFTMGITANSSNAKEEAFVGSKEEQGTTSENGWSQTSGQGQYQGNEEFVELFWSTQTKEEDNEQECCSCCQGMS